MSPEQVDGERLDARTDLFSFGLVLYEMATGQRAFGGKTAAALHEGILNQAQLPVRDLNSTLSLGLKVNDQQVPGEGPRFTLPVRGGATCGPEKRSAWLPERTKSGLARRANATVTRNQRSRGRSSSRKIHRKLGIVIGTILCLVVTAFAVWRSQSRMPAVANIVRLTNDRKAKIPVNGAVTDGLHLYFMEGGPSGSSSGVAQVSAKGGETTWIATSLKDARAILDISPDQSKLPSGI